MYVDGYLFDYVCNKPKKEIQMKLVVNRVRIFLKSTLICLRIVDDFKKHTRIFCYRFATHALELILEQLESFENLAD